MASRSPQTMIDELLAERELLNDRMEYHSGDRTHQNYTRRDTIDVRLRKLRAQLAIERNNASTRD